VVEGAGVHLQFANDMAVITRASEPLIFAGNDAPDCKLIDGATRDLNLMWRDSHSAKMVRAYASDKPIALSRGFFSLHEMTLYWDEAPPTTLAPVGTHIGWWIDFL
jgi:environmental stress-induced protein Ves